MVALFVHISCTDTLSALNYLFSFFMQSFAYFIFSVIIITAFVIGEGHSVQVWY